MMLSLPLRQNQKTVVGLQVGVSMPEPGVFVLTKKGMRGSLRKHLAYFWSGRYLQEWEELETLPRPSR